MHLKLGANYLIFALIALTSFLTLISRSNDIIIRSDDLISRSDDMITRVDDLISRSDDIITRSDDLVSPSDDIISRGNELLNEISMSLRKRISFSTCYINLPENFYFWRYIFIFSCLKHLALQHTFLESSHKIVDKIHKVVAMCYNYVAMS